MSWANARGHERLVERFRRVAANGRLAHAYMFLGGKGVGKNRFAIELAKAILCERTPAGAIGDACDHCPDCKQVEAETHPDYLSVGLPEDKLEFPIKQMQETVQWVGHKPARGRRRVLIVRDADDLNEESANCFLKTLEEPPPASLLILIANNREQQYPTILSRCQIIRFGPLPEEEIARRLVAEEIVTDPDEARRVAARSQGSLVQARAIADPELWKVRRALIDRLGKDRIDSVSLTNELNRFVEEAGKDGAVRRPRAALLMEFVIEILRQSLRVQSGFNASLMDPADDLACRRIADRVPPERLLAAIEACMETNYLINRRVQLVLALAAGLDTLGQKLQAG